MSNNYTSCRGWKNVHSLLQCSLSITKYIVKRTTAKIGYLKWGNGGRGELGKGVFDQLISIILWQIFIFEIALDLISHLIFLCPENIAKFNISAIRPSNPIQLYKIE